MLTRLYAKIVAWLQSVYYVTPTLPPVDPAPTTEVDHLFALDLDPDQERSPTLTLIEDPNEILYYNHLLRVQIDPEIRALDSFLRTLPYHQREKFFGLEPYMQVHFSNLQDVQKICNTVDWNTYWGKNAEQMRVRVREASRVVFN